MRPWLLVLLLAAACAGSRSVPHDETPERADTGRWDAGMRIVRTTDPSRTFGGAARPMQLTVWYPAMRTGAAPLTYGDYLCDLPNEGSAVQKADACSAGAKEFSDYATQLGVTPAAVASLLARPFLARRDAPPVNRRFPLVVLAVGRDESPVLHVPLAERLASDGFVVVSVPTVGVETRSMGFDAPSVDANARDVAFALDTAARWDDVDARRVTAIGYSFGAAAALLTAMHDSRVAAVISIDGVIGFSDRLALVRAAPRYDRTRRGFRLLQLNVAGEPRNDLSLIAELAARPKRVVSIAGAHHLDFTIFGAAAASVPGFHHQMRGTTEESQARAYRAMSDIVLQSLRGAAIHPAPGDVLKVIPIPEY